jgi:hypothetical protein
MDIDINASQSERFVKDLGEASALVSHDIKLLRLEKDPAGFFWFVFPVGKSNEISAAYWADELMIPARKYSTALKSLKDKLFSQRSYR